MAGDVHGDACVDREVYIWKPLAIRSKHVTVEALAMRSKHATKDGEEQVEAREVQSRDQA